MSYENLQNLTPSTRSSSIGALVPKWIEEIESNGYAVVPVYHNNKVGNNDVKSMVVRQKLSAKYPTLYFVHAKAEDGAINLVISNTTKVFKAMKWEYQTYTRPEA